MHRRHWEDRGERPPAGRQSELLPGAPQCPRSSRPWRGPGDKGTEPPTPGRLQKAPCQGLKPPARASLWPCLPRTLVPWVSEAIAVPVTEGGLGQLHHAGAGLVEELGGTAQQPLGLCKRLGQLLLPLHKLGVALHGDTKGHAVAAWPDLRTARCLWSRLCQAALWPAAARFPEGHTGPSSGA